MTNSPSDQIVEVMAEGLAAPFRPKHIDRLNAQAALSALKQAGWRVVPSVASDFMEEAGAEQMSETEGFGPAQQSGLIYSAMLQAHEGEQG